MRSSVASCAACVGSASGSCIEFDDELLPRHASHDRRPVPLDPGGARARVPARIALAELTFRRARSCSRRRDRSAARRSTSCRAPTRSRQFDRGGLEPLDATRDAFAERLARENHTLKRSLTDPRLFSGIGNAYSDEILHRARLSPLKLTSRLTDEEVDAALRRHARDAPRLDGPAARRDGRRIPREGDGVPRGDGRPRPLSPALPRVRHAGAAHPLRDNETNYCPRCQTEGRLLADRALSRLLKEDWPRTVEELEG